MNNKKRSSDKNPQPEEADEKTKKRRVGTNSRFGFAASNLISVYNRKNSHKEDYCEADDVEPIVKEYAVGQLKELSAKVVKEEPLSQSLFSFVVVRACEELIKTYKETGVGDGVTNQRDIVRLERRADDFVLASRSKSDCPHRMRLWAARCRLVSLLETMQKYEGVDEISVTDNYDSMHLASLHVTDRMLANWMSDNEIGDTSVVRQNPRSNEWEHAIGSCGLATLWATIRSLRDRWPFLALSPCLYVIVAKLRSRVAFFMTYRELVNEQTEKERAQKTVKIIGLSRSSWKAVDPNWVVGSKYTADRANETEANSSLTLLNNQELTKTFGEKKPGAQKFICINDDFIEETERVLNSMLVDIRKCAGFKWHEDCAAKKTTCMACALLDKTRPDMENAKANLETIVTAELKGNFRDNIQGEFRSHVWNYCVQPGEKELFSEYRPLDNQKAQSVISRGRPDDGKNINRRFYSRAIGLVWSDFTKKSGGDNDDDNNANDDQILIDYTLKTDPTYAVLVRLTLGFHLDSQSSGGRFVLYTIDCHESNQPFLFSKERFGAERLCLAEFYTNFITTGTLKWRYNIQRRIGLRGSKEEQFYQHPLILKTMASFCVLYKERMHLCEDFAEAFIIWVSIMCEDERIGSETSTEYSLFKLYETLFPERSGHIKNLKAAVDAKKDKWEPYAKVFPKDVLTEKQQTFDTRSTLQY